jgi:argininosuccinate lyase
MFFLIANRNKYRMALLTTHKGLPLAYSKDLQKDLQEDKEAVFDTVDNVKLCLNVTEMVWRNVRLWEYVTKLAANRGYLNTTELADYVVKKGISFRSAHAAVVKVVLFAIENKKELQDLNLEDFAKFSDSIGKDVFETLSLRRTPQSKDQIGGTSPRRVADALIAAKARLADR